MRQPDYRLILARVPRRVKNLKLLQHVFQDMCLLLTAGAVQRWAPAEISAIAAGGLLCVFFFRSFGLFHECVHSAASTKKSLNSLAGHVYGVFCFLPFKGWRALHLDHHQWTGNVEKDPSAKILMDFKRSGFKIHGAVAWAWRSWLPLLAFMQHLVFWRATITGREPLFIVATLVYIGGLISLTGFVAFALALVSYLVMVEAINFPHHLGFIQYEGSVRFSPFEQDDFARSCQYRKWIAHFVLLNFNLHSEHHLYPAHPWYQLDDIRSELVKFSLPLHTSDGSAWILSNRSRPIDEILKETFEKRSSRRVA